MKRRKEIIGYRLSVLAIVALFATSCATPQVGQDPVVIHAEQVLQVAPDALDLVVQAEYQHRDYLLTVNPSIHTFANTLRHKVKDKDGILTPQSKLWLRIASEMLDTYKENRTAENKANLNTWIKLVEKAYNQAKIYIPTLNAVNP